MARFRGTIRGTRGMTSRLGSAQSGLETVCNGWNSGVKVEAFDFGDGVDAFHISITGGSNSPAERTVFTYDSGKLRVSCGMTQEDRDAINKILSKCDIKPI